MRNIVNMLITMKMEECRKKERKRIKHSPVVHTIAAVLIADGRSDGRSIENSYHQAEI